MYISSDFIIVVDVLVSHSMDATRVSGSRSTPGRVHGVHVSDRSSKLSLRRWAGHGSWRSQVSSYKAIK